MIRNYLGTLGIVSMLLCTLAHAQEDRCSRPWPVQLPDAAPADKEQMLELQTSVKDYIARANDYLTCNEEVVAEIRTEAAGLEDAIAIDEAEQQIRVWVSRYNNTVDEMHAVGERFNALVREYKGVEPEGDG